MIWALADLFSVGFAAISVPAVVRPKLGWGRE